MFTECAETMNPAQTGFVLNNLGQWHFFNFIRMSTELKDPQGAGMDAIQPAAELEGGTSRISNVHLSACVISHLGLEMLMPWLAFGKGEGTKIKLDFDLQRFDAHSHKP